jgi:hypothetical protein
MGGRIVAPVGGNFREGVTFHEDEDFVRENEDGYLVKSR